MSKIERATQKIFASESNRVGQFGSAKLNNPTPITNNEGNITKDINEIQALDAFSEGLEGAVSVGKNALPLEEMNGLFYETTAQLSYIFQEGIVEYDPNTTYFTNSIVKQPNTTIIYKSLIDENKNHSLNDENSWLLLGDLSDMGGGGGTLYTVESGKKFNGYADFVKKVDNNNVSIVAGILSDEISSTEIITLTTGEIPTLLSNIDKGYKLSFYYSEAGFRNDKEIYKLFDNNDNTALGFGWGQGIGAGSEYQVAAIDGVQTWGTPYIIIEPPTPIAVNGISVYSSTPTGYGDANAYTLYGSNDSTNGVNGNWTEVFHYWGDLSTPNVKRQFDNQQTYKIYRIYPSSVDLRGGFSGAGIALNSIKLYWTPSVEIPEGTIDYLNPLNPNLRLRLGSGKKEKIKKGQLINLTGIGGDYAPLVPNMASNSQDGYIATLSQSFFGNNEPYKAFNGIMNDLEYVSIPINGYIQIQLPITKTCHRYSISSAANPTSDGTDSATSWRFEVSNDGVNFIVVDIQTNQDIYTITKTFDINPITAKYFRIVPTTITGTNAHWDIGDIQIFEFIENTDEAADGVYTLVKEQGRDSIIPVKQGYVSEEVIPPMTSNNSGGFTASAICLNPQSLTTPYTADAYKVFDGNLNTSCTFRGQWYSEGAGSNQDGDDSLLLYNPNPFVLTKAQIYSSATNNYGQPGGLYAISIYGSNDSTNGLNGTWDILLSIVYPWGTTFQGNQIYDIPNETAYKYYRFMPSTNRYGGNYNPCSTWINEIKMWKKVEYQGGKITEDIIPPVSFLGNIATRTNAICSSFNFVTHSPSTAFDGDITSGWQSYNIQGDWIGQKNLASEVTKIRFYQPYYAPYNIAASSVKVIYSSDNGTTWTDLQQFDNAQTGWNEIEVESYNPTGNHALALQLVGVINGRWAVSEMEMFYAAVPNSQDGDYWLDISARPYMGYKYYNYTWNYCDFVKLAKVKKVGGVVGSPQCLWFNDTVFLNVTTTSGSSKQIDNLFDSTRISVQIKENGIIQNIEPTVTRETISWTSSYTGNTEVTIKRNF